MEEKKNDLMVDGITVSEKLRTKCETWSRPVGYLRPVQLYNNGARQAFHDRKTFKEVGNEGQS